LIFKTHGDAVQIRLSLKYWDDGFESFYLNENISIRLAGMRASGRSRLSMTSPGPEGWVTDDAPEIHRRKFVRAAVLQARVVHTSSD
jgi:hypothetical protein